MLPCAKYRVPVAPESIDATPLSFRHRTCGVRALKRLSSATIGSIWYSGTNYNLTRPNLLVGGRYFVGERMFNPPRSRIAFRMCNVCCPSYHRDVELFLFWFWFLFLFIVADLIGSLHGILRDSLSIMEYEITPTSYQWNR